MVEFGTNLDGCGPDYDSAVGGTWPNGTRSDSERMWCTLSELSLTEIFPFDDHAFFSSPLRHNCLHRYSSLSLYFVRSSLTEIPLVWTLFWNNLELRKMRNLVSTELSLAIIWRGPALCLFGCPTRCEFTISSGESLIFALEVASSILALVSSELDSGMPDNLMSGRRPYCSSSSRSLRRFLLSIWSCSISFRFPQSC